jgi:hypothetical protein
LVDVHTEGHPDKRLVKRVLALAGHDRAVVYKIDERVTIPRPQDSASLRDWGVRTQLITLGEVLDAENLSDRAACVIDADWALLEPEDLPPAVITTDFAAVEGYSFNVPSLEAFLDNHVGHGDAREIVEGVTPVLNDLYLARYVLHRHPLGGVGMVANFTDRIDTSGPLSIDVEEILRSSLGGDGLGREHLNAALERMDELRPIVLGAPHLAIRGHDIAPVLVKVLGLRNRLARAEHVEDLLRSSVDPQGLSEYPLFTELLRRCGSPSHRS